MILLFLFLLSNSLGEISSIKDTIQQGQQMNLSETIVSAEDQFELGFFSPGQPTNNNVYLGIWFKKFSNGDKSVVWVANRDQPLINCNTNTNTNTANTSCFLTITNDGNLIISDGKQVSIPLTSITSPSKNTSATLLDTGNLVVRDITNFEVLWQSFDHISDTFLPGMKLGFDLRTNTTWSLTSWKSWTDPSHGAFTLMLDPKGTSQVFIMKGSQLYWTSGTWDGRIFGSVPEMIESGVRYSFVKNESTTYFTIFTHNLSIVTRFVLDLSGQVEQYAWSNSSNRWIAFWGQPRQQCDLYAYCGAFSRCDQSSSPYCHCLQGFQPYDAQRWSLQDWSGGCVRMNHSWRCREEDGFVMLPNVSLALNSKILAVKSAEECKLACWNNCSCNAYAYSGDCEVWHGELLNVKPADFEGKDIFLRVASSQVPNSEGKRRRISLMIALFIALSMLILSFVLCCLWRRKLNQKGVDICCRSSKSGQTDTGQDLLEFDFTSRTKANKSELSNISTLVSGGTWDVELPLFSLESVSAATDCFSDEKKLGQGGFGPVYKGTLLNGQEVAIKRLSRGSVQGLEEMKNETTLIARLQHRNLVRLLGCCIEGQEKILIYEYMPNKSLDLFLFDPAIRVNLNWERRINIIKGIAQGILYLHQHSRVRIIHRDLKASNILLDDEMNPKISDFGMARIFGGNMSSQANTRRIVGTYGYMSPEYAMQGFFSIKSDVFSFGVLLLEILSGRKNNSFHFSADSTSINLTGHGWNLWRSNRGLEFIDPMLMVDSYSSSTALRYIHVALLCVQEKAIDRPTMTEVVAMLNSELVGLPSPKQPAFSTGSSAEASSSKEKSSINDLTVSMVNAR